MFSNLHHIPESRLPSINKNVCIASKTPIFYAMLVACRSVAKNAMTRNISLIVIGSSTNILLTWVRLQGWRKVEQRKMEKNQNSMRNAKDARLLLSNLSIVFSAKLLYAKIAPNMSTPKENLRNTNGF